MKLKVTAIAVLAALPLLSTQAFANSPSAQDLEKKVFGSLFGEGYWTDVRKAESAMWNNADSGWGAGLEIGYRVNQTWGVRAEYARQSLDSLTQSSRITGDRFGLDAMYHLANTNLYLVGGWKHFEHNIASDALNIGVGYRHFINESVALYAEGNRFRGISNGDWNDASIKAGVTWIFGATPAAAPTPAPQPAPAPAPVVVDSDGDGVPDTRDKCPNTPATHKVDADGCTIYTEKVDRVGDVDIEVRFAFDSAVVSADGQTEVNQLAAFMKRFPESVVVVEGHASNVGSPAYNMRLSERRAKAIADLLVAQGIDSSRITSQGFGVTRLRVQGNTSAAHAANQRIEAKVTATIKEPVLQPVLR
ncbi:OmpA family protein [Alishewanella tabrizica]|uniref:Porin n=1 Tax=Alishewanella tabrizica TaxID=671278 RepID=A0ABQ2WK24_9ALTE|nr:OmpA family protein [Alishewanella tabrizica]GGW55846.1 porin [Alishewanella tabrizica]